MKARNKACRNTCSPSSSPVGHPAEEQDPFLCCLEPDAGMRLRRDMHMVPTSGRNSLTEETANTHTVPHIRTKDVLSVGTDSKGVSQRGQEWPRNGQGKLHGGGGLGRPRGSRASRGEEPRKKDSLGC